MTLDELPSTPAKRPLPQAAAQTSKKQRSSQLVMGVDIEVHDWLEGPEKFPPWVQTTFGHRVRINIPTLSYQRVTQLGWSIYEDDGEGGKLVKTTERCIRPDGWEISQKATKYTNITEERLVQEGTPLRDVLVEFLQDLGDVIGQGGKVVAHNLSYDGCTVHREPQQSNRGRA